MPCAKDLGNTGSGENIDFASALPKTVKKEVSGKPEILNK